MCLRTIWLESRKRSVPCGKCPQCTASLASGWAFRLLMEERHSISSHFITFTYAPDNLPLSQTGRPTLNKIDVQAFFKRLRQIEMRAGNPVPIKYYAVGEYGSQTKRPHYHAIIFNANVDSIELAWSQRDGDYKPVQIGEIYYGDVCGASIGYTLKYISKRKTVPSNPYDDRQPEKSLMSKGLGLSYLSKNMLSWHLADLHNRNYCQMDGGRKIAMPRYYYQKIYDGYQRDLLLMSGSLAKQDQMWSEWLTYEKDPKKSLRDAQLYKKRVDAAFRRHEILQTENLML